MSIIVQNVTGFKIDNKIFQHIITSLLLIPWFQILRMNESVTAVLSLSKLLLNYSYIIQVGTLLTKVCYLTCKHPATIVCNNLYAFGIKLFGCVSCFGGLSCVFRMFGHWTLYPLC